MLTLQRVFWPLMVGSLVLVVYWVLGQRLMAPALADGGLILVDPGGSDLPVCGQAPEPACRTIKYAVEVRATAGDSIMVAGGLYTDSFSVITTGLKIYGAGIQTTVIDGENERGPMVIFGPGLTATTIFSGVTVQNGLSAVTAGGIHLFDSSPLIRAVEISANAGDRGGGLLTSGASAPEVHSSILCGNTPFDLANPGSATPSATGNWWGTNSPQVGQAYSGTVTTTPPISLNLEIHQTGSGLFPGGTTILPPGASGDVLITMLGGGYKPPAGTQIRLTVDKGVFPTAASAITLTLVDGMASTVFTPTVGSSLLNDEQVTLSAYHNCRPTQAVASQTVTIAGSGNKTFLPVVMKNQSSSACPLVSANQYDLIPILGPHAAHPDSMHGDLNLSLRGYSHTPGVPLTLVNYAGSTDPNAPQLFGLFGDGRLPTFSAAYQVNDWNWSCGSHGCPGGPLADWATTLIGMVTASGEPIFIPNRSPNIFSNNGKQYKAMVFVR